MALFAGKLRKQVAELTANVQLEAEARTAQAVELRALRSLSATQLEDLRLRHGADVEQWKSKVAVFQGQLALLKEKSGKYDLLIAQHERHIGGRHTVHGRENEIKWECPCGWCVYAPEGFFDGA